jgi:hypothetical protein
MEETVEMVEWAALEEPVKRGVLGTQGRLVVIAVETMEVLAGEEEMGAMANGVDPKNETAS